MSRVPGGRSVLVRVPASSANLGPGFDSIGLALGLWDHYVVSTTAPRACSSRSRGEGADDVPTDERHLVHATMRHTWGVLGWEPPTGLRIEARNGVPHSRGLGSSATAIVAGVVAAQALCADAFPEPGKRVDVDRCLATHIASVLEGHPDNASASVLGRPHRQLDAGRQRARPWRPDRDCLDRPPPGRRRRRAGARDPARHPHGPAVLPAAVPLAAAAAGAGRAALLVHALTSDPSHLHAATRDWLHQEARRPAYPETMRLVDALRAQGHAAVVSGAGPSVLVLTTRAAVASVHAPRGLLGWQRLTPGCPSAAPPSRRADGPSRRRRERRRVVSSASHHSPRSRRPVHHPHAEAVLSASRCSAPMWFTVGQRQLAPVRLREVFAGSRTRGKDPSCQKPPPVLCLASPP